MAHRILLVDDEAPTREALARLLERAGYAVTAVPSVPEAETLLAESPPDLLITDVRVKTYNGLQLIAMAPARCAAMVITGFVDPTVESDARRLGAECLFKPVTSAALYAAVERLLSDRAERPRPQERRESRAFLPTPLSISWAGATGRLLAASRNGAGLEFEAGAFAELPDELTFEIPSAGISIVADIVWKRYHGGRVRFGVAITEASRPKWHAFLASLPPELARKLDIPPD